MVDSPPYCRDGFGQGGLNDQLNAHSPINEIGVNRADIRWRDEPIGCTNDDTRRLRTYRDDFADNAEQVASDFYDNLTDDDETVE